MKMVYLAGSIYNNPDPTSWRVSVIQMLPKDWYAINPCDYEKGSMTPDEIVELDHYLISKCQAIIARVIVPSWGTAMELAFAKRKSIPVIGWSTTPQGSPWLLAHTSCIHSSLKDAIKELEKL